MNVTQLAQDMTIFDISEKGLWAMVILRSLLAGALCFECGYRLSHMGSQAKLSVRLAVFGLLLTGIGILMSQIMPVAWPERFHWSPGLIPNEVGMSALAMMYIMQRTTRYSWEDAAKSSPEGRALPEVYKKDSVKQCERRRRVTDRLLGG